MNKRELYKYIKTSLNGKKHFSMPYNYSIEAKGKTFYVKVLQTSANSQLTINSQSIWELVKGKVDGIRFKKTSSQMLNISHFMTLENKIVVLTNKPYRILKYLNESDVVDISKDESINGITIVKSIEELNKALN